MDEGKLGRAPQKRSRAELINLLRLLIDAPSDQITGVEKQKDRHVPIPPSQFTDNVDTTIIKANIMGHSVVVSWEYNHTEGGSSPTTVEIDGEEVILETGNELEQELSGKLEEIVDKKETQK